MNQSRRKQIRFACVLLWFAVLFTWMLSLSQVSIDTGLQIYGSRDHVTGQRAVIRVVGVDTKVRYPTPILKPEHRWRKGEQVTPWRPLEFTKKVAWQAELQTPMTPGIWSLEVRATVRDTPVIASTKLVVSADQDPPRTQLFNPSREIDWHPKMPVDFVNIAPLDGTIKRGFQNRFVLTTPQVNHLPTLSYIDARHLSQSVTLNPADVEGVFTFDINPSVGELVMKVETPDATGALELSTELAYYRIKSTPIQTGEIKFSVQSRDRDKNILVDLWQAQYWLQTQRLAGNQTLNAAQFSTTGTAVHPLWVQAYTNPLNPVQARGGQFILTNEAAQRIRNAWAHTEGAKRFTPLISSKLLSHFLRGQLSQPKATPQLIADSSIHQAPELMKAKHKWMTIVATLLALSTVILLATVLIRLSRHRAELRTRFLNLDSEDELSADQERLESSIRDGVIMLLFIGVLVAGITGLLLNARW